MRKLFTIMAATLAAGMLAGCVGPSTENVETTTEFGPDGKTATRTVVRSAKSESLVRTVTDGTKNKTLAAGADTWGGGGKASTVDVSGSPLPTLELWFGRHRVWYTSVLTKEQAEGAKGIVESSNSSLEAGVTSSGVTMSNASAAGTAAAK